MDRVFIIAEAGVNHNGDITTARRLVDVAAEAGADAVKFQTFVAERLVTVSAPRAEYQSRNTGDNGPQFEMLKKLELSEEAHRELFAHCREKGIIFMSTPFDEASADMLDKMGMNTFKVPSGEITNKPLIRHIAAKGKDIILSTGMSYLDEVESAVIWVREVWEGFVKKPVLTLLHCVSAYPSAIDDSNLLAMATMKTAFGLAVGYSDHTIGCEVSIAAAAMGAVVVEKHFTLDRNMKGPDHKTSMGPEEFKAMVAAIRNVEKALGDGIKRPAASEIENIKLARKSIVAARDIRQGEIFTEMNLALKRPGIGMSPVLLDTVAGRTAPKEYRKDELIEL